MSIVNKLKNKAGNFKETARRARYAKYYKNLLIDDNVILYDSYFGRGGTQAMINVIGREDLENARKEPEKYSNLIVRVGGFSARYVELADDVQLDILNRTLN